jgi:iron complex transport system ATP-binding protein
VAPPAAAAPIFGLSGVSLRRDGRDILCDVDWTILAGERWVVLGPNGSGKTSLVEILATYLRASSGSVSVLGHELRRTNVHDLRPSIGYLSAALLPLVPDGLTAGQIVDAAQAGALLPWYVDAARVDPGRTNHALAAAGVHDLRDRRYGQLSSGEQLRVQVARALVGTPAALLLDEPTANLDIGGRETLIATLGAIASGPIQAMVLVIHRLEDIPAGFTHALLLREGRVIGTGPISDVLIDEAVSACFGTRIVVPPQLRSVASSSSSQSIASR